MKQTGSYLGFLGIQETKKILTLSFNFWEKLQKMEFWKGISGRREKLLHFQSTHQISDYIVIELMIKYLSLEMEESKHQKKHKEVPIVYLILI